MPISVDLDGCVGGWYRGGSGCGAAGGTRYAELLGRRRHRGRKRLTSGSLEVDGRSGADGVLRNYDSNAWTEERGDQ